MFLLAPPALYGQSVLELPEKELQSFVLEANRVFELNDTISLLKESRENCEALIFRIKESDVPKADLSFLKARYRKMQESVNNYLGRMAADIASLGTNAEESNDFFLFEKMLRRRYGGNHQLAEVDYRTFMDFAQKAPEEGWTEKAFFPNLDIHELISRLDLSGDALSEKAAILEDKIRSFYLRDWDDI